MAAVPETPADPSDTRAAWVVAPVLVALLQPAGWNDCPYEIVDDPFPGNCGAYVDTDNDGYCDHGQPSPERRVGAVPPNVAADATPSSGVEPAPDATGDARVGDAAGDPGRRGDRAARRDAAAAGEASNPSGDLGTAAAEVSEPDAAGERDEAGAESEEPATADGASVVEAGLSAASADGGVVEGSAAADVVGSPAVAGVAPTSQGSSAAPPAVRRTSGTRQYYFAWIALGTIAVYSLSRLLAARGILRLSTHRRLWNVVLLLGFLGVGVTGLLLVLRVSYGFALPSPLEFLFWHVESGIVFTIIGAFHLWWHWKYYWRIVRPAARGGGCEDA